VMDNIPGGRFFDLEVVSLAEGVKVASGQIIITALQRAEDLKQELLGLDVEEENILGPSLSFEDILRRNSS